MLIYLGLTKIEMLSRQLPGTIWPDLVCYILDILRVTIGKCISSVGKGNNFVLNANFPF